MAAGHSPLAQFEIKRLIELPPIFGFDLSFTNSALFMILATLCSVALLLVAMRPQAIVPGRLQMLVEFLHNAIADMVAQTAGEKSKPFFPFIFALFMFIMMANALGMVPYGFAATSHIIVTFALAVTVFLVVTVTGFVKHGAHFLHLFVPKNVPIAIAPFMIVIELVSYCVRPFSLAIRLFANMLAGGILLKVFAGMVASMLLAGGIGALLAPLPFVLAVALTGFKLFVALLQAYIFAILSAVYLRDALELH